MKTQRRVQLAALMAAAATLVVLLPGSATAHHGGGVSVTIDVVAEGLDTPRGVFYDKLRHRVLVAEAGDAAGNTGTCAPGADGVIYCYGETGAIFQYSERWWQPSKRIVTGLPSIFGNNGAVLGLHDIVLRGQRIDAVFGLSGDQVFRDTLAAAHPKAIALGQSARIKVSGKVKPIGDLVAFEQENNPEPFVIDSDPFGMVQTPFGTVVADAAGNDVLLVRPNGDIKVLAVIPNRGTLESVPTAVVRGPDGAFYIGELSGFPFPVGEARVLRLVPGQEPTVFAEGFTNIIDIAFDEQDRLIVLEIAKNGLLDPDQTGRLVRVEPDGSHTDLATTGLENPGGVAVAGHGVFYVTNRTASIGDTGQLLKIQVHG